MPGRTGISVDTKAIFDKLRSDVLHLHEHWKYFRQLYADESGERLAILSKTANSFFNVVLWLFLHDTCLSLSRLTDPVRTAGRDNLVLESLLAAVEKDVPDEPVLTVLRASLEASKDATRPFRDHRNRVIAHCDLATVNSPKDNPLPGISRASVEATLDAIATYLNDFEGWYLNSRTIYRFPMTNQDGRFLLQALERAVLYEKLEEQGKVPPVSKPDLNIGI